MGSRSIISLFTTAVIAAFGAVLIQASPVKAQSLTPDPAVIALEIEPVCSDAATGLSHWKVTNKNSTSVTIEWNNTQNSKLGSYAAAPGVSELLTSYVASDPNNTTQFAWAGNLTQTNATKAACQPEPPVQPPVTPPVVPVCVDGSIQQNLSITWTSKDSISVRTSNGQPLCDDVQVFLSAYTMPDAYTGGNFYDPASHATPQAQFSSKSVTLKKGTDGTSSLQVALPDHCKNVQIDVYYAPEIKQVGAAGHGTQNIESKVYPKVMDSTCLPAEPVQPGHGGGSHDHHDHPKPSKPHHHDCSKHHGHQQPQHTHHKHGHGCKHQQPSKNNCDHHGHVIIPGTHGGKGGGTKPPTTPSYPTHTPGRGADTGPVNVKPAMFAAAVAQPGQLANTGQNTLLPAIVAVLLAAMAVCLSLPTVTYKNK